MCFFVTSDACITILVIRVDLFYVKQCRIPETSPRSLGWNTGRSGFSEPGCHKRGKEWGKVVGKVVYSMNIGRGSKRK